MPERLIAETGIVALFLALIGYQSKRQDRIQGQLDSCTLLRVDKKEMTDLKADISKLDEKVDRKFDAMTNTLIDVIRGQK